MLASTRAARSLPRPPVGETVAFTLLSGASARVTVLNHVRSSGCSTVYRGQLDYGIHVAIKAPKGSAIATDLIKRELRSWRSVQHPYILPLLGFNESNGDDPLLLITPWMDNGNLCEYLRQNLGADRPRLVHQIAEGLSYLHMIAKIVHGDLKGENILVSQTGDPLVADFGLSTLIEKTDDEATTESAIRQLSTFVFSAPELLTDDVYELNAATSSHRPESPSQRRQRSKSVKTDVFAFGMVIIEIFTGALPWSHVRDKKRLFVNLLLGTYSHPHPGDVALSLGFNEALWHICQLCWAFDPKHRPNMDHIATIMRYQSTNPCLPEPWSVEGAWENSMGQLRWVPRRATPAEPTAIVPPCRAESCSPRMLASGRDPTRATLAWRDAQEADFLRSGRRRRRPGVTFDVTGEDTSLSRALLSPRITPRNISSRSSVRSPALRRSARTIIAYDLDGHDADVE